MQRKVGATRLIKETLRSGNRAVLHLHAAVRRAFGRNAELMREWETASGVDLPVGRKRKTSVVVADKKVA